MFRFGREIMSARFRLQRSRERASHIQPQELHSKPCWSSELQDVREADLGMDSQEVTGSSRGVRGPDPEGPHPVGVMRSQAPDRCGDGVSRPRHRRLGAFAATLRRLMSGSKVAPLISHEQQNAPSSTVICDGNPRCPAWDKGETVLGKHHSRQRQAVDGKQSGRTARKFSLRRNRLGMGVFWRGIGVVPPDQENPARRSGQTSIYTRGPDEETVNFELGGECNGQNATAGGGDDVGLSSALVDGSGTCDHSDEKRRSLETKTTEFKLATDSDHPVENVFTGATNGAVKKERRKKNNRGLPTRNANGPTSSLNAIITRENDEQKVSCVVDIEANDEHDLVHGSCKPDDGMKGQQGHRQTYLASSSMNCSEENTILTEEQRNKTALDIKPIDLANEIRELSPDARWLRILTITSHLKKRMDLLILRKFSSRVFPCTSDVGREIEENAGRAYTLLEEVHRLSTRADTITTQDKTIQQKSVAGGKKLNKHQDVNPKICTKKQRTVLGKNIKATALGFVKDKLNAGRKRPAQKKKAKQRISSKAKTTTICPALNKRTYNKSSNQTQGSTSQATPIDDKNLDLTALGLPILTENDVEHVLTKRGTPLKLGSGDYGEVFLMKAPSDNSFMAVKRLTDFGRRHNAPDKRTAEMLREIEAMEAVRACKIFPTFLGILDSFTFAQEFVGNQQKYTCLSAYKLLYKSPRGPFLLPLDWTRISRDITTGLKALHRAGWTHNDLHIGNIMIWRDPKKLTATWEAKIIDLGKASPISDPPPLKNFNRMEKTYAFQHCPQMAPEIIEGRSQYSTKTDVYSLGVIFKDIAKQNRLLSCFDGIGKSCMVKDADKRAELTSVLKELNRLCGKVVNRKRINRGQKVMPHF